MDIEKYIKQYEDSMDYFLEAADRASQAGSIHSMERRISRAAAAASIVTALKGRKSDG